MKSQSFTIKDARTRSDTYKYLANQIKRLMNGEELSYDSLSLMLYTIEQLNKDADEYGEYEIIEQDGYQVKHYIQSGTLHSMPKDDIPTYPEPEGDPSY